MTTDVVIPQATAPAIPVYRSGQAPAHLRTVTRLAAIRLQPAPGQRPVCYVIPAWHPNERRALYEPADAAPIVRSVGDDWAWRARRTCPKCGNVREHVVHGAQCGVCHRADQARAREVHQRRCSGCQHVGAKPYPLVAVGWYQERLCRFCVAKKNRAKEALLRAAIRCAAGCGKRTATKREVLTWALANHRAIAAWQRYCPPCDLAHQAQAEQRQAEQRARWEKGRVEQRAREAEARMARENELAGLRAWAAAALADPTVVLLDTETTGLHDDARIVDIAVTTATGEVLLDTLVNPGEPIPPSATAIHGITDEMVAGAPTFSQILSDLEGAVRGKRVLIYNREYDVARLVHESRLSGPQNPGMRVLDCDFQAVPELRWMSATTWEDAMVPYSDWCGDWSEWHGNYRWQALNGGHRALGDCLAVIDCLKAMGRPADEDEGIAP